jgi:hypothetical protein
LHRHVSSPSKTAPHRQAKRKTAPLLISPKQVGGCEKSGLEPHEDQTLFGYLGQQRSDFDLHLKEFLEGVKRYRQVGFFGTE